MLTLEGNTVNLRALEPEDLEFLFTIENDEAFWEVSATSTPFSRYVLRQYLENAHKDIYEVKQLRLVICKKDGTPLGLIDIFDFEPKHRRAAIGIVISSKDDREKGFASEALRLVCDYCFRRLDFHQVYAHVGTDNVPSRLLFEKAGFVRAGIKKDWNFIDGKFRDELLYQLIQDVY